MDSDDIYLQSKTFKELGFVDLPLSSKVYTGQLRCASIVSLYGQCITSVIVFMEVYPEMNII